MKKEDYAKIVKKHDSPSPIVKNCITAFLVGGSICAFAQLLLFIFTKIGLNEDLSRKTVTISLIFLACLFTGIGVFDKLAKKQVQAHWYRSQASPMLCAPLLLIIKQRDLY